MSLDVDFISHLPLPLLKIHSLTFATAGTGIRDGRDRRFTVVFDKDLFVAPLAYAVRVAILVKVLQVEQSVSQSVRSPPLPPNLYLPEQR